MRQVSAPPTLPAAASSPEVGRAWLVWPLVAITLAIGLAWGIVVPPFEAPDESAFFKGIVNDAHGRERYGLPLYSTLLAPAIRLAGGADVPLRSTYNPSFRFVSNRYGRVNMFMHGRAEGASRPDIRRLGLLRLLTLLLWLVSLVFIFHAARYVFGRADLALLVSSLCLALPQFSFFAAKVHPEATATLLASMAYFAFTARVYGRIGRVSMWVLGMAALILAPLSDRQAYFLLMLVPFGLIVTERRMKHAAVAALLLVTPGLLLLTMGQFAELRRDLLTSLAPFLPGYRAGWWNHDTFQYLAFEFAPKLFFGLVGWLGQPSILLPAPIYAAIAVLVTLSISGLFMSSAREKMTSEQRRMAWIFGVGLALTLVPIVYYNILVARTSYGRWLFPSLGPIMIGLVFGFRTFAAAARKRPHTVALTVCCAAALLGMLWFAAAGREFRSGIQANHYGDRPHLIATAADTIVALAVVPLLIEAAVFLSRHVGAMSRVASPLAATGLFTGANVLILFGFVAPLYRPPDVQAFVDTVRGELVEGETGRASALYRIAVSTFPTSTELRQLAVETPILLLGDDDQMVAQLQARIGRGEKLGTHAELMALARAVRTKGWIEPAALRQVLEQSRDVPELAEASALLRVELEGRAEDEAAEADVIRAGGGQLVPTDMHGDAMLDGFTVRPLLTGYNAVTVYFRPTRAWAGHRLWIHAYPVGSPDYIAIDPVAPDFGGWKIGELSWEVFHVPANARYTAYLGVALGEVLGTGYPLGSIGP